MNWEDEDIPRMKLDYSLPTVLSRDEMQSIIDHTSNLKHKAIIATMYSSGLRVSEVVHLHYDDIILQVLIRKIRGKERDIGICTYGRDYSTYALPLHPHSR